MNNATKFALVAMVSVHGFGPSVAWSETNEPMLICHGDETTGEGRVLQVPEDALFGHSQHGDCVLGGSATRGHSCDRSDLDGDGICSTMPEPGEDRITVIFRVDMNGGLDRNCWAIDPARWLEGGALDAPWRTAHIVGGVHEQTPACDEDRTTFCLSDDEREVLDEALGGWAPNRVPMSDDGMSGDTVAGNRIYSFALDVPYWDPAAAPDGAGLRLGYKYTWGATGDLWTGTEEWPGRQRLLEVVDLNGDGVVVRQDIFGDETTNKDLSNLLAPWRGGCGLVLFAAEQQASPDHADCVMDSRENPIDSNDHCDICGDGLCGPEENEFTCPADCDDLCGDGICGNGESSRTCPVDCPA